MPIKVKGDLLDEQTRCVHYHRAEDIIAIRFKCCNTYYPCYSCHEENEMHAAAVWEKAEYETLAILCGGCHREMTINQYKSCGYSCPFCKAAFNPKCANHNHLYFET